MFDRQFPDIITAADIEKIQAPVLTVNFGWIGAIDVISHLYASINELIDLCSNGKGTNGGSRIFPM